MAVINTNISALAAQGSLSNVTKKQQTAMERLSTGLRINSAKDDAAGLAITNRMTSQVRGYAVAIRNSNDGISMTQTAEGALGQIGDMLQRMRELAVQSSNGSNSAENRQAIQAEVSQLKDQINNIAKQTNHNDIKLLDGSAGNIVLQTGINEHDTMSMKFDSAQAKDLGIKTPSVLTSIGQTYSASSGTYNIREGDLIINGVTVKPSVSTADNKSYSAASSSSIAKASAINLVSADSKVVATVNGNQVYGTTMTQTAGAETGTISINGIATSSLVIAASASTSVVRGMVVNAVNFISAQTGVTATDGGDDAHGVILTAADGRNITIGFNTSLSAGLTGLNAAGTYIGTYNLTSTDGSPIKLESKVGGMINTSGFFQGTYDANVAQMTTKYRAGSTSAPTALSGSDLLINGVAVSAAISTDDTATYETTAATKKSSAIATAAAINKVSDLTGVKAKANPNILVGTGFSALSAASAIGTETIFLNGISISVAATASTTRQNVADAINLVSGQTGVTAKDNGDGLTLIAEDGRTISIGLNNNDASASAAAGSSIGLNTVNGNSPTFGSASSAAATAFISTVTLSSDKQFDIASGSAGNTTFNTLGFSKGTFGGAKDGLNVANLDVSSSSGAMVAITALDEAINQVSSQQSRAGAYQNRLDSVISNLTESNQNISASRSRILDTDYAVETTNLAKSQIISQAATAMLAQANQSGQSVLALLK